MAGTARPATAIPPAARAELLRRMNTAALEQLDVVWACADAFLTSGTPADDLAGALGLSRRTFYARLRAWRASHGLPVRNKLV